jgi:hypothetical protein
VFWNLGKNGFDFWDFYGDVIRHSIDGWMGSYDEV